MAISATLPDIKAGPTDRNFNPLNSAELSFLSSFFWAKAVKTPKTNREHNIVLSIVMVLNARQYSNLLADGAFGDSLLSYSDKKETYFTSIQSTISLAFFRNESMLDPISS